MLMYGVPIYVFGIYKHHRTLLYSWFPTVKPLLTYRSFRRPVSSLPCRCSPSNLGMLPEVEFSCCTNSKTFSSNAEGAVQSQVFQSQTILQTFRSKTPNVPMFPNDLIPNVFIQVFQSHRWSKRLTSGCVNLARFCCVLTQLTSLTPCPKNIHIRALTHYINIVIHRAGSRHMREACTELCRKKGLFC